MTRKEIVLALVGAGLMGAVAGAAAGIWVAQRDLPVASPPDPELLARLKSNEDAVAKTNRSLEAVRQKNSALDERITSNQLKAERGAAAPGVSDVPNARSGGARHAGEGQLLTFVAPLPTDNAVAAAKAEVDERVELIKAMKMREEIHSLGAGFALRKLPEEERWRKVKDDLGLTWNQVEDLKRATSERDAAMKDARQVEKLDDGRVVIQRADPGKVAHAQADYFDKVAKALPDETQRKGWDSKSYANVFGNSSAGSFDTSVTTIRTIDVTNPAVPPAPRARNETTEVK